MHDDDETHSVYPRWRGELDGCPHIRKNPNGLSPLARGTHKDKLSRTTMLRFIPTGAGNSLFLSIMSKIPAVYPRWRGELPVSLLSLGVGRGLSPLARGTQLPDGVFVAFARFIPAGAGNSTSSGQPSTSSPVYPRWRGELKIASNNTGGTSGLSPLARGTLSKYTFVLKAFFPIKTTH